MPQDHAVVAAELPAALIQKRLDSIFVLARVVECQITHHGEAAREVGRGPCKFVFAVESIVVVEILSGHLPPGAQGFAERWPLGRIVGRFEHRAASIDLRHHRGSDVARG